MEFEGSLTITPNITPDGETGPLEPAGVVTYATFGPAPLYNGPRQEAFDGSIVFKPEYATSTGAAILPTPATHPSFVPKDRTPALDFAIPPEGPTVEGSGAASFFRLTEQTYSEDAQAGSTVARIVDDGAAGLTYETLGDVDGRYVLDGRDIKLTGDAIAHTGSYHDLAIRQRLDGTPLRDRVYPMWIGASGQDPIAGKLSIWFEFDDAYPGEHVSMELLGVTDKEAALLDIRSDVGDWGEVHTMLPPDHPNRRGDGVKWGVQRVYVPQSTGDRTVTWRVYRAGTPEPVAVISRTLPVLDPATIPAADTWVVSRTGNFTGAPSAVQQGTSADAAIKAANDRASANPQIVYLRRGEVHPPEELGKVIMGVNSATPTLRLLVRTFGTGENPHLRRTAGLGTDHLWQWQGGSRADHSLQIRLSIQGVDMTGSFDAYNITDDQDRATHDSGGETFQCLIDSAVTLTDCRFKGEIALNASGGETYCSLTAYNCDIDEWSAWGMYASNISAGGIVGCHLRKRGLQPNAMKVLFNFERHSDAPYAPGSEGPGNRGLSINGPGRFVNVRWFVIADSDIGAFHGWSASGAADDLIAALGLDDPALGSDANQLPKHQGFRFGSDQKEAGLKFLMTGNRHEGFFDQTGKNNGVLAGRYIIAANHWTGHSDCNSLFAFAHPGAWIVNNVFTMAKAPASHGNAKLGGVSTSSEVSPLTPNAKELGTKIVNNIFVDHRIPGNFRQSDDGSVERLVGDLNSGPIESFGNVLVIPNRTPTGTAPAGWAVRSSLSGLSTDIAKPAWYLGYLMAGRGENGPVYITPTLRAEYATPADTGISARPLAGSDLLGALSFTPTEPDLVAQWGMDGPVTGSTRALGAYTSAG